MVQSGDTIANPISGETYTFMQTAADTDGKLLQIDMHVRIGGGMASSLAHLHPLQEERLIVKSGCLWSRVNGIERTYQAGETLVIPPGVPHEWNNGSTHEELHLINEFEPALNYEDFLVTAFAAARRGNSNMKGEYRFLGMAVVLNKYRDHLYLSRFPVGLQKMAFMLLAPIGKLVGYTEDYVYQR